MNFSTNISFFFLFQEEAPIFVFKMKQKKKNNPIPQPVRNKQITCLLSEEEYKMINRYLEKYKITNRSNWMRQTLLAQISSVLIDRDYPTLFSENEMRR